MEYTRPFEKLNSKDANIAGGKGASLGEMTQAGIPVPPGFVVLANVFEKFIEETEIVEDIDATLETVNHEEVHTVEAASEKIQGIIKSQKIPRHIADKIMIAFDTLDTEFVAVRSSATAEDGATAAWAGQLDTYLNTTKENVLEKVQSCWASLFTRRAIFYRFEKKMHKDKVSVAVVIQKMIDSETSGIAFSVHPVTQDYNHLIIEAGFGLGEAIVSGQITPDSYVVNKDDLSMEEKMVNEQSKKLVKKEGGGNVWIELSSDEGSKQIITDEEVTELSKLIILIEKHYDFPCDIEWAREKGKFYIVQSRPITTLIPKEEELKKKTS